MKKLLLTLALLLAAPQAGAAAPTFAPFEGNTGYQEIKLSATSWYVAFLGNRKTAMTEIETGWKVRAAQLCASQHADYFVEMRYVSEPVLTSDKIALLGEDDLASHLRRVAAVYVPIYSHPIEAYVTPAKMAPGLCVAERAALREPERALETGAVLAQARKDGYPLQ